jgi:Glycosyl transferase family 2
MSRFGVFVPTRDRPALLGFCLEGLASQTFDDIEVVVADNPAHRPVQDVFEHWRRPGWRYVRASEPLSMADNWEFGLEQVAGEYIAVVIDKWVMHPRAFELVDEALRGDPDVELVSWWSDDYLPVDEEHDVGSGTCAVTPALRAPGRFEPREELRRLYSFEQRRGFDRIHHYRGKICFGAFSQELVARIRACSGRVFYPLAPDYTSRVPALALASGTLDMGRPLLVAYNPEYSTGNQVPLLPSSAKSFVLDGDPDALGSLPIPELYSSSHNLVAYDLLRSADRLPPGSVPDLDRRNLVRRAREDLGTMIWSSGDECEEQYSILEAEEARLGVAPPPDEEPPEEPPPSPPTLRDVLGSALRSVPPVEHAARWALRRPAPPPPPPPPPPAPVFESPVVAASAADRLYSVAGREITV